VTNHSLFGRSFGLASALARTHYLIRVLAGSAISRVSVGSSHPAAGKQPQSFGRRLPNAGNRRRLKPPAPFQLGELRCRRLRGTEGPVAVAGEKERPPPRGRERRPSRLVDRPGDLECDHQAGADHPGFGPLKT
jgi:hypothetical protein